MNFKPITLKDLNLNKNQMNLLAGGASQVFLPKLRQPRQKGKLNHAEPTEQTQQA